MLSSLFLVVKLLRGATRVAASACVLPPSRPCWWTPQASLIASPWLRGLHGDDDGDDPMCLQELLRATLLLQPMAAGHGAPCSGSTAACQALCRGWHLAAHAQPCQQDLCVTRSPWLHAVEDDMSLHSQDGEPQGHVQATRASPYPRPAPGMLFQWGQHRPWLCAISTHC